MDSVWPDIWPMRIAGEERADRLEPVINPYDESIVGRVAVADRGDMEDAIAASARAFGETRRLPAHRRADILERVAQRVANEAHALATLMTRESGKPIRFCHGEVRRSVITLKLGADEARRLGGEVMPIDLEARSEGRLCFFKLVPRGPVAAIAPFNFPLNLIAHKLSPAAAVGATTVLKPPPQCPLTGHRLVQLFEECGAPAGSVNALHCPPQVAQAMVEDDRMKVLSFTGSDVVGWKLKSLAGKKQVLLELGGNAPCVIDEGVSLDAVMGSLVMGAWANAGQVCIKVQRILVHEKLFDDFLARFIDETHKLRCGDPLHEETVVGPLIERQHVDRVMSWIAEATAAGAIMHSGGEADGAVVQPTILTHTDDTMRVVSDEVFGPVTVVEPFSQFDEALATCNRTRFGLQAGVYTRDIGRALRAYDVLDYGGVVINDVPTFRVDNFPYGGMGDSGFGREGVRFAIQEMTEPKVMVMRGLSP